MILSYVHSKQKGWALINVNKLGLHIILEI